MHNSRIAPEKNILLQTKLIVSRTDTGTLDEKSKVHK